MVLQPGGTGSTDALMPTTTDSLSLVASGLETGLVETDPVDPRVLVMPNPASTWVRVEYALGLERVIVLDATGRMALSVAAGGSSAVTLNVEGLAAGGYYLQVLDARETTHHFNLIKQ